jgi:predicted nucleotidyltransferase
MATALELGPEGWKPYIEALRQRPDPVPTPEEIAERDRLIEKAREAAAMLKESYGATRAWLFGSLAKGVWFDDRSDVDIAVEGIDGIAFYRAWSDVEAMFGGRDVDLVDLREARGSVIAAIHRDGTEL